MNFDKEQLSSSITTPPDSISDIKKHAFEILKRAGAVEVFPTPVEDIVQAANLTQLDEIEEAKEFFLKTLSKDVRKSFLSGWSKLRGFADLKKKAIFVKPEDVTTREIWPKLHEVGHQILPWQAEATQYLDDSRSLSFECEEEFEVEANACAAELLFQGEVFKQFSNSYRPEFNTIFHLADQFGSSIHSTARKFASDSQEPLALIAYFKSKYTFDDDGRPHFMLGRSHSASEKFLSKFPEINVPKTLSPSHPWLKSYFEGQATSDGIKLDTGYGHDQNFLWESWWNGYNLLVLIRKRPALKLL